MKKAGSEMSQKCPQCGAELPFEETCRHLFNRCMALEFENPTTYGAVHHLTVICYMLQHDGYSRDGWLEARNLLARFIQEGVTPTELRHKNRSKFESEHRTWSIIRGKNFQKRVGSSGHGQSLTSVSTIPKPIARMSSCGQGVF